MVLRMNAARSPLAARAVSNTAAGVLVGSRCVEYSGRRGVRRVSNVWRELVSLHQRWGKVQKRTEGDNIRAQACRDANASRPFTRIVQRKNLPWEKDSITMPAYDPAHIPHCNVEATVGQRFIFSEPIPKAENGQGYLRVTRSHYGGRLHSSLSVLRAASLSHR